MWSNFKIASGILSQSSLPCGWGFVGGLSKTATNATTKIHAKTLTNAAISDLSKKIDRLVYELYALTFDEIELIGKKVKVLFQKSMICHCEPAK